MLSPDEEKMPGRSVSVDRAAPPVGASGVRRAAGAILPVVVRLIGRLDVDRPDLEVAAVINAWPASGSRWRRRWRVGVLRSVAVVSWAAIVIAAAEERLEEREWAAERAVTVAVLIAVGMR